MVPPIIPKRLPHVIILRFVMFNIGALCFKPGLKQMAVLANKAAPGKGDCFQTDIYMSPCECLVTSVVSSTFLVNHETLVPAISHFPVTQVCELLILQNHKT